MEDQLSALGLVLNCVVLWNTAYMDRALDELRAQGSTHSFTRRSVRTTRPPRRPPS